MTVPPVNCSHCGALYMRKDPSVEGPKICNACDNKEIQRTKSLPPPPNPNIMRVQIECSRETLAEIEEISAFQGLSYSDYFLNMHALAYMAYGRQSIPQTHNDSLATLETATKKKGKK